MVKPFVVKENSMLFEITARAWYTGRPTCFCWSLSFALVSSIYQERWVEARATSVSRQSASAPSEYYLVEHDTVVHLQHVEDVVWGEALLRTLRGEAFPAKHFWYSHEQAPNLKSKISAHFGQNGDWWVTIILSDGMSIRTSISCLVRLQPKVFQCETPQ